MPWLFLFLSVIIFGYTWNVYFPTYKPWWLAGFSFFAGWLTAELALHHMIGQIVLTALFIYLGVYHKLSGQIGLFILCLSWLGLGLTFLRSKTAGIAVEEALCQGLGAHYRDQIKPDIQNTFSKQVCWKKILFPFAFRHPDVIRIKNIRFHRAKGLNLRLDLYHHKNRPQNAPILLEIHGGGWMIGSKNHQGLPLINHMAARGWLCVSANYRLSPHATFPEHEIDIKRAIQWIKEHAKEYGGNPDFLVVTGESAGGHLAALTALTANDPHYQPGFETSDTSVQGCMSFYGVYDFLNEEKYWHHKAFTAALERQIMKASKTEDPAAYQKASPVYRIHENAPPFFVFHGDHDTMVPIEDARVFCNALREISKSPVLYAEIPYAQHAFEIFHSFRSLLVISGVERFLGYLYSQYLTQNTHSDQQR